MRFTVDTAGRSGHLVKYATIYSNDRVTPSRPLSITFEIVPKGP